MDAYDYNKDNCTDKLGENSKCFHGKSAFATYQNDIVSYFLEFVKNLFLANDGRSGLVKVKYFSLDEANILKIVVKNTTGENIFPTKEHLRSPSNPDIGWWMKMFLGRENIVSSGSFHNNFQDVCFV